MRLKTSEQYRKRSSTTVNIVQIPDGFNLGMKFIRFTSGLVRPSMAGHDPAKNRTIRYMYNLSMWLIQKYLMLFYSGKWPLDKEVIGDGSCQVTEYTLHQKSLRVFSSDLIQQTNIS